MASSNQEARAVSTMPSADLIACTQTTASLGELPHSGATPTHADKNFDGLEDQTAFLPPRQAVLVFLALSIGVGLAYLDQTMCVCDNQADMRTDISHFS